MYAGSMNLIIKDLPGMSMEGTDSLDIQRDTDSATVTTRYALAEKIILTKGSIEAYGELNDPEGNPLESPESSRTYFALFSAEFPATETEDDTFWSLGYESMIATPSATLLEITDFSTGLYKRADNKEFVGVEIEEAKDIYGNYLLKPLNPATFISPLLYEKSFDSLSKPIEIDIDKEWDGEIIYKSTIYSTTSEDDSDRQSLMLDKYIPTVDETYTLKLIDDVISFEATNLTDNIYVATVSYYIELPHFDESSSITVSRKFLKNF